MLGLQNPDYAPEPWTPADSVAWLKALAWDLRSNMDDEIYRAVMSASVGVEETEKLFPPYPFAEHRPIVEGGAVVNGVFEQDATRRRIDGGQQRDGIGARGPRRCARERPRCSIRGWGRPDRASARTRGSSAARRRAPGCPCWPTTRTSRP